MEWEPENSLILSGENKVLGMLNNKELCCEASASPF